MDQVMPTHPYPGELRRDLHPRQTAGKRLFMLVRVGQYAGRHHLAIGRQIFPAIGVMIPAAVGVTQCDLDIEPARLCRRSNVDLVYVHLARKG